MQRYLVVKRPGRGDHEGWNRWAVEPEARSSRRHLDGLRSLWYRQVDGSYLQILSTPPEEPLEP